MLLLGLLTGIVGVKTYAPLAQTPEDVDSLLLSLEDSGVRQTSPESGSKEKFTQTNILPERVTELTRSSSITSLVSRRTYSIGKGHAFKVVHHNSPLSSSSRRLSEGPAQLWQWQDNYLHPHGYKTNKASDLRMQQIKKTSGILNNSMP